VTIAVMFAVVSGSFEPDQATTGVKVPVWTDEFGMTTPLNPLGSEPRQSMIRETPRRFPVPISPATRVGTART